MNRAVAKPPMPIVAAKAVQARRNGEPNSTQAVPARNPRRGSASAGDAFLAAGFCGMTGVAGAGLTAVAVATAGAAAAPRPSRGFQHFLNGRSAPRSRSRRSRCGGLVSRPWPAFRPSTLVRPAQHPCPIGPERRPECRLSILARCRGGSARRLAGGRKNVFRRTRYAVLRLLVQRELLPGLPWAPWLQCHCRIGGVPQPNVFGRFRGSRTRRHGWCRHCGSRRDGFFGRWLGLRRCWGSRFARRRSSRRRPFSFVPRSGLAPLSECPPWRASSPSRSFSQPNQMSTRQIAPTINLRAGG